MNTPSRALLRVQAAQAQSTDRIVYLVKSLPGGVDGRDNSSTGGQITFVSYAKSEAETRKGKDTRFEIERRIVDDSDVRAAYAKLDPLERFLIESDIEGRYDRDRD
jgi:hypothetical protein